VYEIGTFESSTLVLGGDTLHNSGFANIYLAKYSSAGNLLWVQCPSGTIYNAYASSLSTDAWGNIFIAGFLQNGSMIFDSDTLIGDSTVPTMFIAKFDSTGHIKWMKKATGNTSSCFATSVAVESFG
jgi:hypothetical protein